MLVLGKSTALPGSNCEDMPGPAQYSAAEQTPEGIAFRQHLLLREQVRQAFVDADNSDKLRRAFLRRQRPDRGHHMSGTFVMFWKPGKREAPGSWVGPARAIIQESSQIIWISHSSRVYRVAPEHVRKLSHREAIEAGPLLTDEGIGRHASTTS